MSDAITLTMEFELAPLIRLFKNPDYFLRPGARFHVLKGAVEHLTHVRDCLRRRVRVAARRGRKLPSARRCAMDADGIILAFRELQTEYDSIPKLFWGPSLHLMACHRVGTAATQMLPRVKRLCAEGAGIVRRIKLPQPLDISTGFASRDLTLRTAIAKVKEERNSIVAIWGHAGLAKTHLLKLVDGYFSRSQDDSFDLVLRITVPKDSSTAKVQAEIAKKLLFVNCESRQRRAIIFDFLKKRNFLLLLDCLHQRLDLEEVGVPSLDLDETYRRKIVFTTCFGHVCDKMNVDLRNRIEVRCLDQSESWEFFKHNAGIDQLDRQYLIVPQNVCNILLGSPLELLAIGKAMHSKEDAKCWENALCYLSQSCSHETQGSGTEQALFFRLKLGYNSLTGILKECFKFCSLWPEGHVFDQRKLVDFWIGLGLIQMIDIEVAYNEGFAHIATLQESCLLESGEDNEAVQMQGTLRDLALRLAHNEGSNNKWIVQTKKDWGLAEQVPLGDLKFTDLSHIPSNKESLSVLILQNNHLKDGSFKNFHLLLALQYLDLSFNNLFNIPVEICMQVNLRYLNLSNNRIKKVPLELCYLTELRHLHLRNNPIQIIPKGILPRLQNLEVLDICSFDLLQRFSYEMPLDEFEQMNRLRSLGISVHSRTLSESVSKANLPVRALCVVTYDHEDGDHNKEFSDSSCVIPERRTNLFELGIYTKNRTIVFDSIHSMWNLEHVEKVYIHGYFVSDIKWQRLDAETIFASLRRLDIVRCPSLNNISWILHLPLLQDLLLFSCSKLHQIIAGQDGDTARNEKKKRSLIHNTFPRLRRITLIEADELVSICNPSFTFPSLECLQISLCPLLKKLPFLTIPSKLKCIRGENEWWDGLEWEDENLESSLELYFHGFPTEDQSSDMYLFNSLEVEWARMYADF